MRGWRSGTVVAALLLSGVAELHAGNWFDHSEHIPQWALEKAKTPTPDSAKGAARVILYDEYVDTVDVQGHVVEREREVFRILQPQGRGQGCSLYYDEGEKIKYFRAWTIAADGHQFQARESDFTTKGDPYASVMLDAGKTVTVHPPAADVGSVVVCESEESLASWKMEDVWNFQYTTPVVEEALEFDLPPGMKHFEGWHAYTPVKPSEVAPNHWRWELHDVPALDLRQIKTRPSFGALAGRMNVVWGETATEGREAQWRALGQWYVKLEEHRTDPTPELAARAQELVAGQTEFFAKIDAISEYIQKHVRYFIVERGLGGFQTHFAGDVFRSHSGDCKDKAALTIAMLRTVGIDADFVMVDDKRGVVDSMDPSNYGNHMILAIELPASVKDERLQAVTTLADGRRVLFFDPTNERTPVGNLPDYLQGGYGLLVRDGASQIVPLPVLAPAANGTEQKGSFTLTADGQLKGSVESSHSGPEGADLRLFLKYTDEKERREFWEKLVASSLQGVVLGSFQFVQPESLQKPIEFHYTVTVPQYAHPAGQLLLVRARVLGAYSQPFDDKPRKIIYDLGETGRWRDSFDIALPDGYVVDELPDPVDLDVGFASYHAATTVRENHLHYEREYAVRQVQIPAEKAADFRRLQGSILADESGAAVLKKK